MPWDVLKRLKRSLKKGQLTAKLLTDAVKATILNRLEGLPHLVEELFIPQLKTRAFSLQQISWTRFGEAALMRELPRAAVAVAVVVIVCIASLQKI